MTLSTFKNEVRDELFRILDYWQEYSIDHQNGGFYGTVNEKNEPVPNAEKSVVVNSRILWTFSSAIIFIKTHPELYIYTERLANYENICKRAYDYLIAHFWDHKNGGVYWNVDAQGKAISTPKSLYGHSFFVYGMSEYYRATQHEPALAWAQKCFDIIIDKAYDQQNGGYFEGFAEDWSVNTDYILASGASKKSMNTHLHLLECYANLYRVDKSPKVQFHLKHCLDIMLEKILGAKNQMTLFFTADWQPRSGMISYGHDIEASWLILEAAEATGDEELIKNVAAKCLKMAAEAVAGLQSDDGMIYEKDPETGEGNFARDWWVMAEAMVGFYNAYQLSGKVHFLEKAEKSWAFVKKYLIDYQNGEWWPGVNAEHQITGRNKINPWKGPYHNARACMELYGRIG